MQRPAEEARPARRRRSSCRSPAARPAARPPGHSPPAARTPPGAAARPAPAPAASPAARLARQLEPVRHRAGCHAGRAPGPAAAPPAPPPVQPGFSWAMRAGGSGPVPHPAGQAAANSGPAVLAGSSAVASARCRLRQEQRGRPAASGLRRRSAAGRGKRLRFLAAHRRAAQRQPATVTGAVAGWQRQAEVSRPTGAAAQRRRPAPSSSAAHQAGAESPGSSSSTVRRCRPRIAANRPDRVQQAGQERRPRASAVPIGSHGKPLTPAARRPARDVAAGALGHLVVPHGAQAVPQPRHVAGRQLRVACRQHGVEALLVAHQVALRAQPAPVHGAEAGQLHALRPVQRVDLADQVVRHLEPVGVPASISARTWRRSWSARAVGGRRGRRAHVAVEEPQLVVQLAPQHRGARFRAGCRCWRRPGAPAGPPRPRCAGHPVRPCQGQAAGARPAARAAAPARCGHAAAAPSRPVEVLLRAVQQRRRPAWRRPRPRTIAGRPASRRSSLSSKVCPRSGISTSASSVWPSSMAQCTSSSVPRRTAMPSGRSVPRMRNSPMCRLSAGSSTAASLTWNSSSRSRPPLPARNMLGGAEPRRAAQRQQRALGTSAAIVLRPASSCTFTPIGLGGGDARAGRRRALDDALAPGIRHRAARSGRTPGRGNGWGRGRPAAASARPGRRAPRGRCSSPARFPPAP